ncbi:nicotinamide riboside transporter PnuC [Saccharibacillus kuerlensis]|uniref:Nicotinamide mononucleotide transporter PnuC n=1 Tax=Saccharibacillus kuerlensis TaxID=459527 RepID=A0ABQ2LAE9_9BACL|nr:nicotinamide riboside transporter PnuC [Saccharibacillus kuerlensis]GGO06600.1 nicotinamide mononucleotide transporter PnuC [Saccharibacillus kuerlensis]
MAARLRRELFSGWTTFEAAYILAFLAIQIIVFALNPDNWLSFVSGFTGILCVTFVAKGKISNYAFGLVQVSTYLILAYQWNLMGEFMLNWFYLAIQFIGFYIWSRHMMKEKYGKGGSVSEKTEEVSVVKAKGLKALQYVWLTVVIVIGWLAYAQLLVSLDSHQPYLDGLTVVLSVTAQLLMVFRFKEQWWLWVIVNVLSIILWVRVVILQDSTDYGLVVMYVAYLFNSVYGALNWQRLQNATRAKEAQGTV